jgi:hypothetical protein
VDGKVSLLLSDTRAHGRLLSSKLVLATTDHKKSSRSGIWEDHTVAALRAAVNGRVRASLNMADGGERGKRIKEEVDDKS